jgi:predicted ATP-grasp superfamily ATP-dependent carboligase
VRIFVYEHVTGGGYAGRDVPMSLAREGVAMRTALLADLAALDGLEIATITDRRFLRPAPAGVTMVPVESRSSRAAGALMRWADAVWVVAPETDGCLARLATLVERRGKRLLGSSAPVVRAASDKAALASRLALAGLPHPTTIALSEGDDPRAAAERLGFPLVVKPRYGAGAQGVRLVRSVGELRGAIAAARRVNGTRAARGVVLLQTFVPGLAASVSLVSDGRAAVPLTVNAQRVRLAPGASYRGGRTPLDHPLAAAAAQVAVAACAAFPGLRGYVGVDLVLTGAGPIVIELNPRLTTAYLGVRAAVDVNVAALALAACDGRLPMAPLARRRVRFTAAGRVAAA